MPQHPEHTSNKFWLPLAFAFVLVLGILLGVKLQKEVPIAPTPTGEQIVETQPGKLEELLRYIEARYVDDVDRDELIQKAIDNILQELEPHSTYIPSDQLQRINEQLDEGTTPSPFQSQPTIICLNSTI